MMTGIIALGGAYAHIKIVAAYPSPDLGGYSASSGSPYEEFGSMLPRAASAIPRGAPKPNADGKILAVVYELYEGVAHTMYVVVTGDFAALPFTELIVDDTTVLTGWTVWSRSGTHTSFRLGPIASGNPIPAGTHSLRFV